MTDEGTRPDETESDGRRRKGKQRRRLLLDATMRVIERDGVAGVTQRAVAREAELPPSAVMYYFPTIDDLLRDALVACNDDYIERLEHITATGDQLDQIAELIATSTVGRPSMRVAAEYELFLRAAREPDLRPEIARWTRALDMALSPLIDDPIRRAGIGAAVDGLFIRSLCAEYPLDAGQIKHMLRRLVGADEQND